jgi:hypothetical protein
VSVTGSRRGPQRRTAARCSASHSSLIDPRSAWSPPRHPRWANILRPNAPTASPIPMSHTVHNSPPETYTSGTSGSVPLCTTSGRGAEGATNVRWRSARPLSCLCKFELIGRRHTANFVVMEDTIVFVRPKLDRRRVPRERDCDRYPVQSSTSMPGTASVPASVAPPPRPLDFSDTTCPNCHTSDHVSRLRTPGHPRKRDYRCATCGELWATLLDGTPC